jgi:hypothetical protein
MKELKFSEIPREIFNEIQNNFKHVVFALDSDICRNTKSMKCEFSLQSDELIESIVLDPNTFMPWKAKGYVAEAFMIRVYENSEGAIIRRVFVDEVFKPVEMLYCIEVPASKEQTFDSAMSIVEKY